MSKTNYHSWIAALVAVCLLFVQIAAAAHVCPRLLESPNSLPHQTRATTVAMADCSSMSAMQMNKKNFQLCKIHCDAEQQSFNQKNDSDIPSLVMGLLGGSFVILNPAFTLSKQPLATSHAPPLSNRPIYLVNQIFRL